LRQDERINCGKVKKPELPDNSQFCFYFSEGTGISRSLQMLAMVNRLISGCRGMAVILPDWGFKNMEWLPPSRKSSHP
jgi:hypothetical protein